MISDRTLLRRFSPAFVRQWGDLVRVAVAAAWLFVVAVWVGHEARLAQHMLQTMEMSDFGKFYYAARLFLDGRDMYGPSPATGIFVAPNDLRQFWDMNPPHFHLLLLPLALFPPMAALTMWTITSLAALVASLRIIAASLELRWTLRGVTWTVTALLLCSATGIVVATGQVSLILMWPMTLAWHAARQGRWTAAGGWIGLAAGAKPFLALFGVYLLLARRTKAVAACAAAIGGSFITGLLVFGVESHRSWIGVLAEADWYWVPMNSSVFGVLQRGLSTTPVFKPMIDLPGLVVPLGLGITAVIVGTTLVRARRDVGPGSVDRAFAAVTLAALLTSPLGWIYYGWLALGPLVAVVLALNARSAASYTRLLPLAVPGLIWPVAMTGLWRRELWAGVTLGSTYGWATIVLWVVTVTAMAGPPRAASWRRPG